MSGTMRAAVVRSLGLPLAIDEVPVPTPGPGEVLVKIEASGVFLCAGVTTYKGIKETEARPGEWVVISGVGGLGHIAVQYAKAMGVHVVAVDVSDGKLALARSLGADGSDRCRVMRRPVVCRQCVMAASLALVRSTSVRPVRSRRRTNSFRTSSSASMAPANGRMTSHASYPRGAVPNIA